MKRQILPCILLALCSLSSFAQSDSTTTRKVMTGMAIYADFGVLSNSSMDAMRKELTTQSVKPFSSLMSSIVLAQRGETSKWIFERKIIIAGSKSYDREETDVKRATLRGIGIGATVGRKLVSTSKINVSVPVGIDLMYYRMKIKSNPAASLNKVIANPGIYQAVKLGMGTANVNVGITLDYKTGWFGKAMDNFYISPRLSYQIPVLRTGQWKGDNVQVNDLTSFKPQQLYAGIGVVMMPKNISKHWRQMH